MNAPISDAEAGTGLWLRRATFWLFLYLPLSMPGHILVNHFTHTTWSWPTLFLCPETLGVLLIVYLSLIRGRALERVRAALATDRSVAALLVLAMVFNLWVAISAVAQAAYPGYWARSLLAGWVLPILLALALLGARTAAAMESAWKGLAAGSVVLLLESLVLYFVSFGFPTSFHELIFVNRTGTIFRGIKGGVFFGEMTLGSVNDIAVFFAAGLAVLVGFLLDGSRRRRIASAGILIVISAALALEYLCYSRGVLLSLAAISLAAAVVGAASPRLRTPDMVPGLLILLFFFVSLFAADGSVEYWAGQFRHASGSSAEFRQELWKGALTGKNESERFRKQGSAEVLRAVDTAMASAVGPARKPVPQACTQAGPAPSVHDLLNAARKAAQKRVLSRARRLAFGFGLGNYGLAQGMTYEAGTHNTYLDALVNSGIVALVAFCGFWVVSAFRFGMAALTQFRTGDRGAGPPPLSVFLAFCVVSAAAFLVNFRFENLGTMVNGGVFWLMVASIDRKRKERPGDQRRDWKAEAIKQWDFDPCGADLDTVFGSREFFARVERERYADYAPWMNSVIGFERYSGKRLLEVGFGLGTDHVAFARGGARCFGIDLTPAHVWATKQRLTLEGFPRRLTRGDAESLPFADGSTDVVYSFGVLHHTPGTAAAINEIYRVLRPGGEAIVGLYHRNSAFYWGYCILVSGLLRGGFLRDGYRKTISRIERREHSDAVPLVKVYSRRSARRLFRRFHSVETEVQHFDFDHAGWPGLIAKTLLSRWESGIARRFGWYLIIRARK